MRGVSVACLLFAGIHYFALGDPARATFWIAVSIAARLDA